MPYRLGPEQLYAGCPAGSLASPNILPSISLSARAMPKEISEMVTDQRHSFGVVSFLRFRFANLPRPLDQGEEFRAITAGIVAEIPSGDFLYLLPGDIPCVGGAPKFHAEGGHGCHELEVLRRLVEGYFPGRLDGRFDQAALVTIRRFVAKLNGQQFI